MKRLMFVGFCLLGAHILQAQVPGFMGKRFTVFAEPNFTPAIFVMNENNVVSVGAGGLARAEKNNLLALNYRPQVTIEYLLKRDLAFGLSYSMLRIGTTRQYETPTSTPDFPSYLIDYDVVKGRGVGVHLKFYNFRQSSSIAPIGFYTTVSAYLTQTNTYDDKKSAV